MFRLSLPPSDTPIHVHQLRSDDGFSMFAVAGSFWALYDLTFVS